MGLTKYRTKRDFKKTREPPGRAGTRAGASFVVQEHWASRHHFDFRLELDGVLKSWAVPKGPSTEPGEKRLAVHVEDHPLEYGKFRGTIPEGEYGAGRVEIWDRGTWKPLADSARQAYAKGRISFELKGKKLKGRWTLVRMGSRSAPEKQEQWLLIKGNGEAASGARQKAAMKSRAQLRQVKK